MKIIFAEFINDLAATILILVSWNGNMICVSNGKRQLRVHDTARVNYDALNIHSSAHK